MAIRLGAFVLGTPDPEALADFYAALLGWQDVHREPTWVRLRSPEGERPGLSFQLETTHVAPVWPPQDGTQQMQAHLDIEVDDLDTAVERAVALGATVDPTQHSSDVRVMRDPHGHVFCLFLPGA